MNILAGAYTSKGIRERNEDSFLLGPKFGGAKDLDSAEFNGYLGRAQFFAAADGMGGHDAGDVASDFVVRKLREQVELIQIAVDDARIEDMIFNIHNELVTFAQERGTPKMGSTVAGIVLQEGGSGFFNAGDSRVYRMRHGYLQQLSADDSLSAIDPRAAKNIITNAIGAGRDHMSVASRFSSNIAVEGDIFLLCSDGVHGSVSDDDLAFILALEDSPVNIAQIIVERAVKNDSDDNCTAVVVKIESPVEEYPA
jgi:serine/threonine protein phosphatase PrpC